MSPHYLHLNTNEVEDMVWHQPTGPAVLEHTGEVRLEIFRALLSRRTNREYHLGLPERRQ